MVLAWEKIDPDRLHLASAPLFGKVYLDRYGDDDVWRAGWSVPGFGGA